METKTTNNIAGVLFILAGGVTLIDGIYSTKISNICIGICFVLFGCLYLFIFYEEKERRIASNYIY